MFFVSTKAANRALGAASDYLSAFDAGDGRTPLTIIGVDYRNSDFGVYPEIAIALTVTAKGDPAGQLFVYYLAIVVTQEFTREAARSRMGVGENRRAEAHGQLCGGRRALRFARPQRQSAVDPVSALR